MTTFIDVPPAYEAVVITKDMGGTVSAYERAVAQYTKEGRPVKILGDCNSACTLALAVPKVCVGVFAAVRWHQAYMPETKAIRSDITERMLHTLPKAIQSRIEGRIQVSYSPEATLYAKDLIALGIPLCDDKPEYNHVITASVSTSPSKPIPEFNPPSQQESYEDRKIREWVTYTNWAYETSLTQFGKYRRKVVRNGASEKIYLSYWDSSKRYVTAAEYKKNGVTTTRLVCRADEPTSDLIECTNWMTEAKYSYEYDLLADEYVQVSSGK